MDYKLYEEVNDVVQREESIGQDPEILLDEVEEGYPHTAAIIRQVIKALGNIGI